MARGFAALLLVCGTGCRVVDAPDNLEDLVVFGFVHFTEPDEAYPAEAAEGLVPLAAEYATELAEGYRVDELDQEDIDTIGLDASIEEGVLGVAAKVAMTSSLDDFAWAWSWPRMDEVSEITLAFEVLEEEGDRDCFLSHECESYGYDAWRQNDMGLFGQSEQNLRRDFRWTALLDGTPVLTIREMVPDETVMSSNIVAVHQQYNYAVLFASEDGIERLDAFWIEAEVIGSDIPDTFALDFAVNSMQKTAESVDAFVDANR